MVKPHHDMIQTVGSLAVIEMRCGCDTVGIFGSIGFSVGIIGSIIHWCDTRILLLQRYQLARRNFLAFEKKDSCSPG